jgi:hypothetical protein
MTWYASQVSRASSSHMIRHLHQSSLHQRIKIPKILTHSADVDGELKLIKIHNKKIDLNSFYLMRSIQARAHAHTEGNWNHFRGRSLCHGD